MLWESPNRVSWYDGDNRIVKAGDTIFFTFQSQSGTPATTLFAFDELSDTFPNVTAVGNTTTPITWMGTTTTNVVLGSQYNGILHLYAYDSINGFSGLGLTPGQNFQPLIVGDRVYYHLNGTEYDGTQLYMLDLEAGRSAEPTVIAEHASTSAGQDWMSLAASENGLAYAGSMSDELWIVRNAGTAATPTSEQVSAPWLTDNDDEPGNNAPINQGPRFLNFQHGDLYFWTDSVNHGSEPWILPLASLEQDTYEPNNSFQEATDLQTLEGTGSINNLTIHEANDIDVFRFDITQNANESHFVAIDLWNSQAGDLDLELYQLRNGMEQLIDASASVSSRESISMRDLSAGSYYIKIVSFDGRTNGYDLSWNLPINSLLPDEFEPGNIIGTFVDGYFAHENLTLHTVSDTDSLLFTLETWGGPNDYIRIQGNGEFWAGLDDFDNLIPWPAWSNHPVVIIVPALYWHDLIPMSVHAPAAQVPEHCFQACGSCCDICHLRPVTT